MSVKISDDLLLHTKVTLWENLRGNYVSSVYEEEERKIKNILDMSFKQRASSSVVVVGPECCRSKSLISKILLWYGADLRVAKIQGKGSHGNPLKALVSLANQLMGYQVQGSFGTNIETVQKCFRESFTDNRPTVIVVEDFHEYALVNKAMDSESRQQTLLYTLLDLIHKKDSLFVVIGVTHRADIQLLLEKRVRSRLNAQYILIPALSAADICTELSLKCHLLLPEIEKSESEPTNAYTNHERAAHVTRFNRCITDLFGPPFKETESASTSATAANAPHMLSHISRLVADGLYIQHFIDAVTAVVLQSTPTTPYFSESRMQECLLQVVSNHRTPVSSVLAALPTLELYLIIAITRLSSNGIRAHSAAHPMQQSAMSSAQCVLSCPSIQTEFNKLTSMMVDKSVPFGKLHPGMQCLLSSDLIRFAEGNPRTGSHVGAFTYVDSSLIYLNRTIEEVQNAFSEGAASFTTGVSAGVASDHTGQTSPGIVLQVPPYVRKAILNPLEPIQAHEPKITHL